MLQSALLRAFRPTTALMGRLTYPQKFALTDCVLLAPLAFVAYTYFGLQGTNKAFSAEERVGVAYIAPLNALLGKVVSSEEAADAVAAVDAAAPLGAQLGTADEWTQARDKPTAAALEKLIVDAGNGSNLILDPDLDSFYLMDAVVNKLPLLVDTAGKLGSGESGVQLAVDKGVLASTSRPWTPGSRQRSRARRTGRRRATSRPRSPRSTQRRRPSALPRARRTQPQPSPRAPTAAVSPRLDQLIEVRIGKVVAKEHRVEWVAALAVLLALYLFVGFYLAVRKGLTAMRSTIEGISSGDLDQQLDFGSRDEIGQMEAPFQAMLGYLDEAATTAKSIADGDLTVTVETRFDLDRLGNAFQGMVGGLRQIVGDIAATAGRVAASSEEMAASSEEAGRAVGEISRAVSEVAAGASARSRS